MLSDKEIFFHNLKFDGNFIINYLLKNNMYWVNKLRGNPGEFTTLISGEGMWYQVEVIFSNGNKIKIKDSLKKLPAKVSELPKMFGLEQIKGDIDYHKYRPIGYTPNKEELMYLKNDCEIVGKALAIQFSQNLKKMTVGSDALQQYKKIIGYKKFKALFPLIDKEIDYQIRQSYRGGFCWVNPLFAGKTLKNIIVFDVNSLYPYVMYSKLLPYGEPVRYEGIYEYDKDYPLYTIEFSCAFDLKENKIPTVQMKNGGRYIQNEYITTTDGRIENLVMTNVDFELFQEHYDIKGLSITGGYKFKAKKGLFRKYINKYMEQKEKHVGGLRTLAKLMLNSLYGKYGSSVETYTKIPYLEEGVLKFRKSELENKDPVYIPMATFITAYARRITIESAQANFIRICYCDTDSIHLLGDKVPDNIEVHKSRLGAWKHEGTASKAKFLKQKTYIEEIKGELDIKCAGMNQEIKDTIAFDEFNIGYSTPSGSKKPKSVKGGVILNDLPFKIT